MSESNDAPIVVTLKGGKGYDAPWIVVRADTADGAAAELLNIAEAGLYQATADAASLFQGAVTVTTTPAGSGEPAQVTQAATPAPARQDTQPAQGGSSYARRKASAGTGGRGGQRDNTVAPGVVPEACAHGDRSYREGVSPKGPWAAWFCASPKGTPGQCDAIWVRD